MRSASNLLASRLTNLAVAALMASLWCAFAISHISGFQRNGDWSLLLFCASETLVALLFVLRSEPIDVSKSPFDWILAIASTFSPFAFAPVGSDLVPFARMLIVAGVCIQIAGLLSLNRSFGLVAARRQVKTGGMYKLVRHPLYASYMISYVGYVLTNSSNSNVLVCLIATTLLIFRMLREERFLSQDATYRIYMRQVKYRVLPMVF
jgi:protein-S-isoprenylcysteine O-methyltransferase Ste14